MPFLQRINPIFVIVIFFLILLGILVSENHKNLASQNEAREMRMKTGENVQSCTKCLGTPCIEEDCLTSN